MRFEDLAEFLRVRPGHGVAQEGDDLVETPFVLPGTTEPLVIRVTRMTGGADVALLQTEGEDGPLLVTDGGALAASLSGRAVDVARLSETAPEGFRTALEATGAGVDDEGRVFVVAGAPDLLKHAVAAVTSGVMMLGTLAAASR